MRLIVAVCGVKLPEVPVITTAVGPPVVAERVAVTVKVLVAGAGLGLNDAVTPLGRPVAAKLTLPLNPFVGFTVITLLLLESP